MSKALDNVSKLNNFTYLTDVSTVEINAAISAGQSLFVENGQHVVLTVPSQFTQLDDAIAYAKTCKVNVGGSITIEVSSTYSLASAAGFTHPDGDRVKVVFTTLAVGSDAVPASTNASYDAIRNGHVIVESVNVPPAPAAGASSTVSLSSIKHLFSFAERVNYFPATGEGIDAFSLPSGCYRLVGTEIGNFPLTTSAQKAGLLVIPAAEEGRVQWFLSDTGGAWRRVWTRSSGAPVWGSWRAWSQEPIDNGDGATTGNFNWNTLTEPGIYRRNSAGAGTSNGPTTNFVGLIEVISNHTRDYILQRAQGIPAGTAIYTRSFSGGAWSAWRTFTGV